MSSDAFSVVVSMVGAVARVDRRDLTFDEDDDSAGVCVILYFCSIRVFFMFVVSSACSWKGTHTFSPVQTARSLLRSTW